MYPNAMNPYWWMPPMGVMPQQPRSQLKRIDVGGIFKISTNSVVLDSTASQVVYGFNPCEYRELPCESLILLTIHADVPTGGEGFPVLIAIPGSSTTTSTTGATSGSTSTKVPVVDSQGNNVTGANVQRTTERLLYLNKRTGTARFIEFTNAAGTAATTPTE